MEDVNTKKVLGFMLRESFKSKKQWVALFLMPTSSLVMATAIPFITSNILAKIAQGQTDGLLRNSIPILTITALVGFLTNKYGFILYIRSQVSTAKRVQSNMMSKLLKKSGDFYANRMTGKIISDGITLINSMVQFQDLLIIRSIPFVLNLVIGIAIVSINSWQLGFGLMVITLSVIVAAFHASNKRSPLRAARHEARRALHGQFADVIANNQNVKVFAREREEQETYSKLGDKLAEKQLNDFLQIGYSGSNRIATILILQGLFVCLVIHLVSSNPALLATSIFAFSFTLSLSSKLFEVGNIIQGFENVTTDSWPMISIMAQPATIVDAPDAQRLAVNKAEITLKDVVFDYPENKGQKLLFNGLSLSIKSGEKVGLVGHSGGGKSTITKLLLRLADIQDGEILIDGQNIAGVTQKSLREAISYVSQEPLLFHRSVAENISYGKPDASRQAIAEATKKAYAHEFVDKLVKGYDTLVGERGVKLSGGQKQRVAIARAMLKDAPILVLDEATSALDSESEVLIQKALWKLMEGRTAIVIAHRLSTIQKMDRIIVLDNGNIAEEGSHTELLKKKGKYAELWAHQSGGFIED